MVDRAEGNEEKCSKVERWDDRILAGILQHPCHLCMYMYMYKYAHKATDVDPIVIGRLSGGDFGIFILHESIYTVAYWGLHVEAVFAKV